MWRLKKRGMGMRLQGSFVDLETKGYVVARSFLSPEELATLRADYEQPRQPNHPGDEPGTYHVQADRKTIDSTIRKVVRLAARVGQDTDIQVDLPTTIFGDAGAYFCTAVNKTDWHVDAFGFYLLQECYQHLNFWLPIIKPLPNKSGLAVVPMDKLAESQPKVFRMVRGHGAVRLEGDALRYEADGCERHLPLEMDLDEIGEAPDIEEGDLLLTRGEVLHAVQDDETLRVAWTLRVVSSKTLLLRSRMLTGSAEKHRKMLSEPGPFRDILAAFLWTRQDQLTVGEILAAAEDMHAGGVRAAATRAAAKLLLPLLIGLYRARSWVGALRPSRPAQRA